MGRITLLLNGDWDHPFYSGARKRHVRSKRPSGEYVRKNGDYAKCVWMKHFFDGTIDMRLQSTKHPKGPAIFLLDSDAARARQFANPLRDAIVLSIAEGSTKLALRDGYHRLFESRARGYRGRVWVVVRDGNIDDY